MTGRGAGYCAGFGMPGYTNPGPGRGFGGWGGGRGGGWRHGYYATGVPGWGRGGWGYPYPPVGAFAGAPSPEDELRALRGESESLEEALGGIRKRIEELEAGQGAS